MRVRRSIFVVLTLVAVVAVVFAALALMSSDASQCKLPDGSVLRVEKASYGKRGRYVPPVGWKGRLGSLLERILPGRLKARVTPTPAGSLGMWYQNSLVHSNNDALHIWLTRRELLTSDFRNVGVEYGEITDSHGCVYRSTQSGGENFLPPLTKPSSSSYTGVQSSVVWLTFEGFPRHETQFNLRLYNGSAGYVGEMVVANPAPRPKPAPWSVGPFPVMQLQDNVLFILTKVVLRTNYTTRKQSATYFGIPVELVPTVEVRSDGILTKDWEILEYELWDISGNYASRLYALPFSIALCPRESAWKMNATFYGHENAPGASNIVWKVTGVKVPGPGEFTTLETQSMPHGMTIRPIAIGGAGETTYSNGVVVSAAVLRGPYSPGPNPIDRSGLRGGNTSTRQIVRGKLPHVAVFIAGLANSQKFTIRTRDDQGREVYADQWQFGGQRDTQHPSDIHYLAGGDTRDPAFFELNLWPDAKTVDLTFCIHQPRTVEFIFKPPQPDTK